MKLESDNWYDKMIEKCFVTALCSFKVRKREKGN